MNGSILGVKILSYPALDAVITFQSGIEQKQAIYHITICNFPACTFLYFTTMLSTSIGKRGKYVNCKHLYYIFYYLCKVDFRKEKFIHAPSLSMDEVMTLLQAAGMMKSSD